MGPKKDQDKLAWQWAETTEPEFVLWDHVETAYRVNLKPCKLGTCRRNCKGNPNCLNALGEREWQGEFDDKVFHDIEDPESERREEGARVGLKNLGATCYVNTFLQVWFHNTEFRAAIYQWRDSEADFAVQTESSLQEGHSHLMDEEEKWLLPSSACGQLQYMFALLQHSKRRYVDPTPFITCLGLDAELQQDAQEFSKLFMSVLERSLVQQLNPVVRNLVQDLFQGQYTYITRCSVCGGGSHRDSTFYELDLNIKGNKDLQECINEFLEEEKLEGDNKYHCLGCNSKQDAVRKIRLSRLPKVLNFQLLRFVFERKTGHKKKLNTYIQFPEVLDMGQTLGQPEGEVVYNLAAVLIHRGPSAYSGHYVAHIKDVASGSWYKFNDEDTKKMEGRNLQLGNEEEVTGGAKKPRTSKGAHASRNAYMLVYHRRQSQSDDQRQMNISVCEPSDTVMRLVHHDNLKFEDWVKDMTQMREKNVTTGRSKQREVLELSKLLPRTEKCPYEWISTDWLMKWYASETMMAPPVDNSAMLCSHKKIDPDKVTKMKCVSQNTAEILYTKYGGQPRLKSDMLCRECVQERCKVINTKTRLAQDHKTISNILKKTAPGVGDYWIGKSSLRSWRRLVMEQISDNDKSSNHADAGQESKPEDATENPNTDCDQQNGKNGTQTAAENAASSSNEKKGNDDKKDDKDEEEDMETVNFNEDLLCEQHNGLAVDSSCRRLIPAEIWLMLKRYFPSAPEFPAESSPCLACQDLDAKEEPTRELYKQMATEQKSALSDLYFDRHRAAWNKGVSQLNVIPTSFIEEWRRFIKDPLNNTPVFAVNIRELLCDHGGLPYQPESIGDSEQAALCSLVWPEEWQKMMTFWPSDSEISLFRVEEDNGLVTFVSSPDVCEECLMAQQAAEFESLLNYKNATIYVRKLTPDKSKNVLSAIYSMDTLSTQPSSEETEEEFLQDNKKRKKNGDEPCEKMIKLSGYVRRSSRHRRMRGEKEILVSSDQSLKDLKVQIMKLFSVVTIDQRLMLNGQEITADNNVSLSSLKIMPGSIVYLMAEEPRDDPLFMDDVSSASYPEEGFRGTGLLGTQ